MGVPRQLRHRPVVAHVVQRGRRDEAPLHERVGRRLHVERVPGRSRAPSNSIRPGSVELYPKLLCCEHPEARGRASVAWPSDLASAGPDGCPRINSGNSTGSTQAPRPMRSIACQRPPAAAEAVARLGQNVRQGAALPPHSGGAAAGVSKVIPWVCWSYEAAGASRGAGRHTCQ